MDLSLLFPVALTYALDVMQAKSFSKSLDARGVLALRVGPAKARYMYRVTIKRSKCSKERHDKTLRRSQR